VSEVPCNMDTGLSLQVTRSPRSSSSLRHTLTHTRTHSLTHSHTLSLTLTLTLTPFVAPSRSFVSVTESSDCEHNEICLQLSMRDASDCERTEGTLR